VVNKHKKLLNSALFFAILSSILTAEITLTRSFIPVIGTMLLFNYVNHFPPTTWRERLDILCVAMIFGVLGAIVHI
jgi:hypothetical protein